MNLAQHIAQQQALKEERDEPMTISERIRAAFNAHGPMTTRQLRVHVPDENVAALCGQLADRAVLGRLGGSRGNTIYGLPDQHAPAATAPDKPPRSIHPRKRGSAARAKAIGGGALQCANVA